MSGNKNFWFHGALDSLSALRSGGGEGGWTPPPVHLYKTNAHLIPCPRATNIQKIYVTGFESRWDCTPFMAFSLLKVASSWRQILFSLDTLLVIIGGHLKPGYQPMATKPVARPLEGRSWQLLFFFAALMRPSLGKCHWK